MGLTRLRKHVKMITLTIIVLVVLAIYAYNKKDKRSNDADEKIQELPPIHYRSKKHDSGKRFWTGELFESNSNVLLDFSYGNGYLTLKTKSGEVIRGLLSAMSVRFDQYCGQTHITVKSNGNKIEIIKLGNFSDDQWETMVGVLLLAGTTYGADIFSSWYKNMGKANIALKIISKLC